MSLMGCLGCEFEYVVGLLRCPHCGTRSPMVPSTGETENDMPKITVSGASNADEPVPVAEEVAPPVVAPVEEDPAPVTSGEDLVMLGTPGIHGAEGLEILKTAPAQDGELSAADVAAGYTDLSFAQLRAEAKTRGLPAGGTAVELAARLADHDTTAPNAVETASETTKEN